MPSGDFVGEGLPIAAAMTNGFLFGPVDLQHVFNVDDLQEDVHRIIVFIAQKKLPSVLIEISFQGNKNAQTRAAQVVKPFQHNNQVITGVGFRYTEEVFLDHFSLKKIQASIKINYRYGTEVFSSQDHGVPPMVLSFLFISTCAENNHKNKFVK
jgi:hypothetical protein